MIKVVHLLIAGKFPDLHHPQEYDALHHKSHHDFGLPGGTNKRNNLAVTLFSGATGQTGLQKRLIPLTSAEGPPVSTVAPYIVDASIRSTSVTLSITSGGGERMDFIINMGLQIRPYQNT